MKPRNYSSSQEYAASIIESVVECDLELPAEEQLDPQLLSYWCEEIIDSADKLWKDYTDGERDSYKFSVAEMEEVFEKAKTRLVNAVLEDLLEKKVVEMGVRVDGELVYKLTKEGQDYLKQRF